MRSPASARLTASTEIGRLTPSGATVIGSTTVSRSGTTGSSDGSDGAWGGKRQRQPSCRRSSCVVSRRLAVGGHPRQPRRKLGDAFELREIDPVDVVVRRVVIRMEAGREEHRGNRRARETASCPIDARRPCASRS